MYWVGRRHVRQQEEASRQEREWRAADEPGRKEILSGHRATFVAERQKLNDDARAKRSASSTERMRLLQEAKCVPGSRRSRLVLPCRPTPRSPPPPASTPVLTLVLTLVLLLLAVNGGWVRHEDRRRDGSGGLAERTYR